MLYFLIFEVNLVVVLSYEFVLPEQLLILSRLTAYFFSSLSEYLL